MASTCELLRGIALALALLLPLLLLLFQLPTPPYIHQIPGTGICFLYMRVEAIHQRVVLNTNRYIVPGIALALSSILVFAASDGAVPTCHAVYLFLLEEEARHSERSLRNHRLLYDEASPQDGDS